MGDWSVLHPGAVEQGASEGRPCCGVHLRIGCCNGRVSLGPTVERKRCERMPGTLVRDLPKDGRALRRKAERGVKEDFLKHLRVKQAQAEVLG